MRDIVERELACGRNMAAKQLCRIGGLDVGIVLLRSANIYCSEAHLQDDQSIGARPPTPGCPEQVARKKKPKSNVSLGPGLRSDEPRRCYGQDHGRPLQEIGVFHKHRKLAKASIKNQRQSHPRSA